MVDVGNGSCIVGSSCGRQTSIPSIAEGTYISSIADVWIYSFVATMMVSLCGVIPIIFIPLDGAKSLNTPGGLSKLRLFLSFAVGSLLGDVFLHLLPEAWRKCSDPRSHLTNGLLVVFGVLSFSFIEKLCESTANDGNEYEISVPAKAEKPKHGLTNGNAKAAGDSNGHVVNDSAPPLQQPSKVTGYLNLFANCVDNFSHGLAIGGSYLVSFKVGALTTFAILLHEIPHEIGDFAILVRSGFTRRNAAKAQFLTAAAGLLGASAAVWTQAAEDVERKTSWILPFAAGGFLNIALVNLLPELLQERRILESFKQMVMLSAGVLVMATVTLTFEAA